MAWQGVPFLFDQNLSTSDLVIALSRMPKIIVDSPPDYTNLAVTAIVSLTAGLFPALIAVWTFKRNADNTRVEREIQQQFLREERSNQQAFLESDRMKQQESFEEDRKTQIEVAKKNFNMQVLSGNRQEWINNLREVVSEYSALAPREIDLCCAWKIQKDCVENFLEQIKKNPPSVNSGNFEEKYENEKKELYLRVGKLDSMTERVKFLQAKIRMMLNPKEDEYQEVIRTFLVLSRGKSNLSQSSDVLTTYDEEYSNILDSIHELTSLMQSIFKKEWERVKDGI